MTVLTVQATGSFAAIAPSTSPAPETLSATYRVLAPTAEAAEVVARQLLVAQQAGAGLRCTGRVDAAAAG